MIHPDDLKGVSWSCVHFLTGEEAAEVRRALAGGVEEEEAGEAPDLRILTLDGAAVAGDAWLFARLAEAFAFPAYFGRNWDALDECLRDLSWLPAEGYVLFVEGARAFWERSGPTAGKLVETWLFAAEAWGWEGVSFHLVFVW